MFGYYLDLALRSLKRNKVLTTLMVLALALGIGATITTLAVLRLLSGDPIPQKSAQLFYPQLDPYPANQPFSRSGKRVPYLMSYIDAMNLIHARKAERQAAMAMSQVKLTPPSGVGKPFYAQGVLTTTDFFPMFDAPFQYGSGWTAADDEGRAQVAVIAGSLNDKLFGGANSVGRMIRIEDHDFRIIGVLRTWAPQPRFYAVHLGGHSYGEGDAVFVPLQGARADDLMPSTMMGYGKSIDVEHLETAPAIWLGLWVQLPNAADVAAYKMFLGNYAKEQVALGRYQRTDTALSGLMEWMRSEHVVPDDVRLQAGLAFGFLLICVVNTVGLLLAKCLRRSREIGVRRALGASRGAIFTQFMVEAAIVGVAGGVLGLVFAELGLWGIRHQPAQYASLAHLDLSMFLFTFVVALLASLVAGLLPAWRACVVAPAPQLKAV
ncbi:ABC transporter ATP-binding protein [Rhodanobacter sp. C06]|uniref:ABC transporter permease n=1 Tax=Rhodanobacter sp. C06 TaxID=1945854 RepID=UPI0009CDB322|nr:ABC transporter permease [Rhodanobacter sp. C06]OOG36133.1 ABC transporter ATP-binding protein [Rhodanobacter sp. C06]OOG36154.1 ABC transporter ATP-binding protein [Rhodanobacter sp. C06]